MPGDIKRMKQMQAFALRAPYDLFPDLEGARWAPADNFADLAFACPVLDDYEFSILNLENGRQSSYADARVLADLVIPSDLHYAS